MKPGFYCLYCTEFSRNNQQRQWLNYVLIRVRRTRASQRTQTKLCRWRDRKHAVCASSGEDCLFPRSRRSRASTCRRRPSSSSSTTRSVCFALNVWPMPQSRQRREWQGHRSRMHHYLIPSARGDARDVCEWVSSNSTRAPMRRRVACSAEVRLLGPFTVVFGLLPRVSPPTTNGDPS